MQKIVIWQLREVDGYSYHSTYENAKNAFIKNNNGFYDLYKRTTNQEIKKRFENALKDAIFKWEFELSD